VQCAESLRVQAYFDGEVDAIAAADIERHVEHCAECTALLQDLERVRSALRKDVSVERAPPELRAKIALALDRESAAEVPRPMGQDPLKVPDPRFRRVRPFWAGALGGVGATALAACLAMFLLVPRFANPLTDELVNAHVRSLMPAHLIDVVSTDRHTVKPWFAGHADVSPVVADFESQGYRLVGGRVDYLDHQRSAVVVYQHGAHVINVFSWAANGRILPGNATRSGYHLVFWKTGDLAYCAISDTASDELDGLVRLLRE
jgi:anti-sigma factor (TIGR02949 family)